MQWDFVIALVLITALTACFKETRRSGIAFALCWVLQSGFVILTGIYDPWQWFAVTNIGAAFVVLKHPAGAAQSFLGSLLMLQGLVDISYGIAGNEYVQLDYLITQTNLGWLALVLLATWGGGHFIHSGRSWGDPGTDTHGSGGVG